MLRSWLILFEFQASSRLLRRRHVSRFLSFVLSISAFSLSLSGDLLENSNLEGLQVLKLDLSFLWFFSIWNKIHWCIVHTYIKENNKETWNLTKKSSILQILIKGGNFNPTTIDRVNKLFNLLYHSQKQSDHDETFTEASDGVCLNSNQTNS